MGRLRASFPIVSAVAAGLAVGKIRGHGSQANRVVQPSLRLHPRDPEHSRPVGYGAGRRTARHQRGGSGTVPAPSRSPLVQARCRRLMSRRCDPLRRRVRLSHGWSGEVALVAALHWVIRFPLRLYDMGHVEDAASDRWRQARGVLRAHPSAQLTALNEVGLFVPLPPGMDGAGHEQLLAASGREAVEPVDHPLVTEAWARLLSDGYATAQVRCRRYPEHLTRIELFDVRPAFGVFAAVTYATALRERAAAPDGPTGDAWPRLGQVRKDLRAVITHADQAAERMLGYPPGGLVGVESRELVHPDDQDLAVQSWLELSSRPGGMERVRLRKRRADGSWLWVDVINHNRLQDPAYGCVVADVVDVSQEMAFREDVRTQERLLRRLTEALPVGVVQLLPTGEVAYSNERVHQILGTPARSSLDRLLDPLSPGDKARVLSSFTTAVLVGVDDDLHGVVAAGAADRTLEVALRPLIDDAGAVEGVLVCLTDVTEDMRLRAELEQRATYDVLTGCLNRGAVLRRLDEELRRVAAGRLRRAVPRPRRVQARQRHPRARRRGRRAA